MEKKVEKEKSEEGRGVRAAVETFPKLELSKVAFSFFTPHLSLLKTHPEWRVSEAVDCG